MLRHMVLAHKGGGLLLKNTPWDVALIDVLVLNVTASTCCFLLSALHSTPVSIEAVEVDKLLVDQVALTLIVLVATAIDHRDFGLAEVCKHFLVINENLNGVGQDLRQL